jgi:hypothetical protein
LSSKKGATDIVRYSGNFLYLNFKLKMFIAFELKEIRGQNWVAWIFSPFTTMPYIGILGFRSVPQAWTMDHGDQAQTII